MAVTRIEPLTRRAARRLRSEMTEAEKRLWRGLRQLNRGRGFHFRRQAPIGRYIVDFAELGRRVIIEIDRGQHGGANDLARDTWLGAQGFRVFRFWNTEVLETPDAVIERIARVAAGEPPPSPSPTRGEGSADAAGCAAIPGDATRDPATEPRLRHSDATPSALVGEGWGGGLPRAASSTDGDKT